MLLFAKKEFSIKFERFNVLLTNKNTTRIEKSITNANNRIFFFVYLKANTSEISVKIAEISNNARLPTCIEVAIAATTTTAATTFCNI